MNAMLAAVTVGPIQFDTPIWLWLIPIGWALCIWFGRSSLSGLGTLTRRVALGVRLIVLVLIAGAMAEPQWRKVSKDVAVTFVLDSSKSIPLNMQKESEVYVEKARKENPKPNDQLGIVTVGAEAYVQSLPSKMNMHVERQFVGPDQATNLAGGIRLALAVKKEDAAYRLVLITDGNETTGSLLAAAEAAKAAGVPIDVLPVRYAFESEVVVDQLVAPSTARMGENINLKIVLDATRPAVGRLSVLMNGDPIDLDPDTEGMGQVVELKKGRNTLAVPITVPRAGPQQFKAVFEALAGPGGAAPADSIRENNESLAVTFVSSEGRVLVVFDPTDQVPSGSFDALLRVLNESKIATEVVTADQCPKSLTELNGYDAIILANEPAYNFSQQAQEELRQYVHETGGGLVMLGGPDSFGAGGWIGSPLEDALPVKLDPPQKRQMPRGGLVLISHSIEMPNGVSWGKKTAAAAIDALSRLDLAGIVEFQGGTGASWVHPISEVGDGSAIKRSINNLMFGDMMDYGPAIQLALQGLSSVQAGTKHIIMITDGDAQPPSPRQIQQLKKEKITVSTVGVFPHGSGDLAKLAQIARDTGGRHYEVVDQGGLGQIVQIFIKEAQTVKRSLIWEGDPFVPSLTPIASETMRGISGVAPMSGYVVTGEREGLAMVLLRGKENDPILALWQYGLGRAVAYTSDATPRWNPAWIGWPGFKAFWEQHVRWAMRPTGSANLKVTTEKVGEKTKVRVDALDAAGERMNFAKFKGRVAMPDGTGQELDLQQVGPGVYEGSFDSKVAGSYVVSMRYAAPKSDGSGVTEGSVQAAVTKPFADEFRALTDNTPLLQQIAAMTGGKVLEGDASKDLVWRPEGIKFPVATTPIWLVFALVGIGMFLMDVGVRRVRIDIPGMARAMQKAVKGSREKAGQQMDALRVARETAQRVISERGKAPPAEGRDQEPVLSQTVAAPAAATAKVKFEAPGGRVGKKQVGPVALGGEAEGRPGAGKAVAEKPEASKEEGMSRLMKAKKRAQEDMKD